jgi:cytochrome P450
VQVFAGSDTTAIALRATLYYLMKNPEKMTKLLKEISDADAADQLSNPVQDKEARALPYLNAVEKEAMRMHPSVGLLMERHVPAGGRIICGEHIPAGTIVGINPWVLHNDAQVFPNPEAFEPERWLESSADYLAAMEKSYLNFGAGSRSCIGRNISLIEMRKIIPQLLREFELEMVGGKEQEWKVHNMWFTQQELPHCVLRRRIKSS